jgi:hypothetical protein
MPGLTLLAPLLGGILIVASARKAFSLRSAHPQVDGLFALLPSRFARRLTWGVVVVEVLLGTSLWWDSGSLPRAAAVVFASGLVGFLIVLRRRRPGAGCGCAGKSKKPVSRRDLARAATLLVLAVAVLFAPSSPWTTHSLPLSALVAALVAVGYIWLGRVPPRPARLDCATRDVPEAATVAVLHRSAAFLAAQGQFALSSLPDVWREGCWRFFAYEAGNEGQSADLVFAVYLGSPERPVRMAVLEKSSA